MFTILPQASSHLELSACGEHLTCEEPTEIQHHDRRMPTAIRVQQDHLRCVLWACRVCMHVYTMMIKCFCVCAPNVPFSRGNLCLFIQPLLVLLFLCGSQRDLSRFLIGINMPELKHIILISPMLDLAREIRAQRTSRFPEPCPNTPKNVVSEPVNLGSLPSTLVGGQKAKAAPTDSTRAALRSSQC